MKPDECKYCEYDRKFPETAGGGWVYMGNNGPISPCPMCNSDGKHPRTDDERVRHERD
jgi:hypothetical protein